MRKFRAVCAVLALGVLTSGSLGVKNASAAIIDLLLESDANAAGGSEIFIVGYNSLPDLLSNNIASQSFSQLDINANFSVGGFTFDGSGYQVLLESNANTAGGSEIFIVGYNSLPDLLSNNIASQSFSQLDINANYSVGGFTFDGSGYQVLLESNANTAGGSEIFIVGYNSLPDLLSNNIASQSFSQLDINANYSVGGFTFDGSGYQVLLESDANAAGGSEIFIVGYNSLPDLLSNNIASQSFSQLDINANFSVGGMAARWSPTPPPDPTAVPEPAAGLIFGIGLLGLAVLRRRDTRAG